MIVAPAWISTIQFSSLCHRIICIRRCITCTRVCLSASLCLCLSHEQGHDPGASPGDYWNSAAWHWNDTAALYTKRYGEPKGRATVNFKPSSDNFKASAVALGPRYQTLSPSSSLEGKMCHKACGYGERRLAAVGVAILVPSKVV